MLTMLRAGFELTDDCTIADTSPPGIYPVAIPSGVVAPDWAYYDYVTAGHRQQAGPEPTTPPGASSTATTTVSTTTVNNSCGGPNTDAIEDGVVGGVLVLHWSH
ncbi:hypothetical protein RSOL_166700 [Rhizoctonia solani AG-3 Rhs1AP]|uniref:Uncharacterized protein n=2 Tax=Rhizoctonia solani AG-3 TaxID=1086053 RepID=A0A074RVU1_9AGAM|nr:hypothetical protein RSOL_166700 [Rhizoctonia solani AG-3 Rhs1AP]KEP49435.1 hypothetical protein V565_100380 [Rhizoctonia solani 123E]